MTPRNVAAEALRRVPELLALAGRAVSALETQADAAALSALLAHGGAAGSAYRAINRAAVDTLARRLALRASADPAGDRAEVPANDPPRGGAP